MTEPAVSVQPPAITDAMKGHLLANRSGIATLVDLLEAGKVWDHCTKPQQALLAELIPPVLDELWASGMLTTDELPVLPERVSRSSWAALRRRGLADERGRLTACAVHTWFYAGRLKNRGDA